MYDSIFCSKGLLCTTGTGHLYRLLSHKKVAVNLKEVAFNHTLMVQSGSALINGQIICVYCDKTFSFSTSILMQLTFMNDFNGFDGILSSRKLVCC